MTTMNATEREALLPCPFCGTETFAEATMMRGEKVVVCRCCNARGPTRNGMNIEDGWNRRASAERASAETHVDRMEDALYDIKQWSEAYPLDVFPEPDFKKAHEVLTANGMTLDAISASNMRHVITRVQKIVDAAMNAEPDRE